MLGRGSARIATPLVSSIRNKATGIKIENVSADFLPYKGTVAQRKPTRVELQAGKTYVWCACGLSQQQPFCDGSHKLPGLTDTRPVKFQVEKNGTYSLCNCKQTDARPICDGSHKATDPTPKTAHASQQVNFNGSSSPVYNGVAHGLGYKPKNGGFQ